MTTYRVTFHKLASRFLGDKLAHEVYHVTRNGRHVATIHDHGYGRGRWACSLSKVRGMESFDRLSRMDQCQIYDFGPMDDFLAVVRRAIDGVEFILAYRNESEARLVA